MAFTAPTLGRALSQLKASLNDKSIKLGLPVKHIDISLTMDPFVFQSGDRGLLSAMLLIHVRENNHDDYNFYSPLFWAGEPELGSGRIFEHIKKGLYRV